MKVETVTVGIIAYNEQSYLPLLLDDLLKQTYDKKLLEIIIVDGDSSDSTWDVMENFQRRYSSEYINVKILKNHKRTQPSGWNVVINNMTSDILIRVDAHARLPENFIETNVSCINSGEYVCGGPRENIIDEDTPWKRTLLAAEQSMFGSGFASYRQDADKKRYEKSLFHAAYRREVLNRVGGFNENLIRTEDNEFHYRIRSLGYKICYDPNIHSYYQTRNSLKGMLKQKFLNGMWIGRTLFICPGCVSLFHLVPLAFVLAILGSALVGIFWSWLPAAILWLAYGIANIIMTVLSIITSKKKELCLAALPILFLELHIAYGVGTLIGLIDRR